MDDNELEKRIEIYHKVMRQDAEIAIEKFKSIYSSLKSPYLNDKEKINDIGVKIKDFLDFMKSPADLSEATIKNNKTGQSNAQTDQEEFDSIIEFNPNLTALENIEVMKNKIEIFKKKRNIQ